jgi:hypothetical protein
MTTRTILALCLLATGCDRAPSEGNKGATDRITVRGRWGETFITQQEYTVVRDEWTKADFLVVRTAQGVAVTRLPTPTKPREP